MTENVQVATRHYGDLRCSAPRCRPQSGVLAVGFLHLTLDRPNVRTSNSVNVEKSCLYNERISYNIREAAICKEINYYP